MIRDVQIKGKRLLDLPLRCKNMDNNCNDADLSEYVCPVKWLKTVSREDAKWRSSPKLYTTTHVRASLDGQPETILFLEQEFGIKIREIIA